jgi:hypothetical protein
VRNLTDQTKTIRIDRQHGVVRLHVSPTSRCKSSTPSTSSPP